MFEIILLIAAVVMPYTILGEETAAVFMAVLGIIYLAARRKNIIIPKDKISAVLSLMAVSALISQLFINSSLSGIWRMVLVFDFLIYYVVFKNFDFNDDEKNMKFYRAVLYASSLVALYSIIVQGIYYSVRIYGNIGYANTYAVMILCLLLYGHRYSKNVLDKLCTVVLITAVIFTGSRIAFILVFIILAITFIKEYKAGIELKKYPEVSLSIIAFISYVVLAKLKFAGLVILPLILMILYGFKDLAAKIKNKKVVCIVAVICVAVCIFTLNINSFNRIRNISLNNGSLQERLVMYEDGIKAVAQKPLGHGLASYAVLHNYECSADYPVKYVHNSIIQSGYEMGIIGMVLLAAFMIISIAECKDRINRTVLCCIFLSSMLNFDFAYVSVVIAVAHAASKNSGRTFELKNNIICKTVMSAIIVILSIAVINESIVSLTTFAINRGSTTGYNVISKWSSFYKNDERIYNNIAGMEQQKYLADKNTEHLKNSIQYLRKSREIFDKDGRVNWNLAYCYKKTGDYESYMKEMDKASHYYLYSKDYYDEYEKGLNECYKAAGDNKFKDKIEGINKRKNESHKSLNKKAVYMKDQI